MVEDRQSWSAWQTVNEVSSRKSTLRAKLKAASQEERILKRRTFQKFTWKPSEVTDKPIQKMINGQLDIKVGHFMEEELDIVLKKN